MDKIETFADYILNEKNSGSKMEIAYYLSKKERIFFDKSVIFKTEVLRLFLNSVNLEVDNNLLITASLLASCKKIEVANNIEKIRSFAQEGAEYLYSIGFDKNFCDICVGINRYKHQKVRAKESDILELVDQFAAMLLDRQERVGMKVDEALVLLEYRNLKDVNNQFLHTFVDFIRKIEEIKIKENGSEISPLNLLVKTYKDAEDVKQFITAVVYEYEVKVDDAICRLQCGEFFKTRKNLYELEKGNPNRPLFSEETTRKVIGKLVDNKKN